MNNLSWLIYIGDICSNLGGSLFAIMMVSAILTIVFTIYGAVQRDNGYRDSDQYKHGLSVQKRAWKIGPTVFFIALILNTVVPSKDTVYLIAASQAGEKAIQTPEFGKVRQVINKWLDKQVEEEPVGNQSE